MNTIKNIPYNKMILIDEYYYNELKLNLYLEKSYFKANGLDQYFLKLIVKNLNGSLSCIAYIYFYLDFDKNESKFIGIYTKTEYRNNGFASLLISNWIKFCLDNGIYNLETNKKQRKPFLLYLLKTFYFELRNKDAYKKSGSNIDICSKTDDYNKYLLFQNEKQKKNFINGNIYQGDNYHILDFLDEDTRILDTVLLSHPYIIQDDNAAYSRSLKKIDSKK